jgi:hypothetical protein
MSDTHIRIRGNRNAGELEIEGPADLVMEWWEKCWPLVSTSATPVPPLRKQSIAATANLSETPDIFGEFFHEFRSDVTDVDRVLIAAAFVQSKDAERAFSTKAANQLLIDQNIKLANPSEGVRRLLNAKRAFVVSDGKFRVSSTGLEHLDSLKQTEKNQE